MKDKKRYAVFINTRLCQIGTMSNDIVKCLTEHIITLSVVENCPELQEAGQSPVCLFPTRELCNQLNNEMLASFPSPKVDIFSSDNVDETASMRTWNNKTQKHLEKLNSDINQTAGLEG